MNRSIETVIEGLLPALYKLQGSPDAVGIAHRAAESLMSLIDTGALRDTHIAVSNADFLNMIALDPDLSEQDATVAKILIEAIERRTGVTKLSYAQIAEAADLSTGSVRGSVSRLRGSGYFSITYPTQKDIDDGDHCLRYRPDMRTRIML